MLPINKRALATARNWNGPGNDFDVIQVVQHTSLPFHFKVGDNDKEKVTKVLKSTCFAPLVLSTASIPK